MSSELFRDLLHALGASFRPPYVWAHALAITLTALLVLSGFDWWFFERTRAIFMLYPMVFAGIIGFFVPIVVPLGIYLRGVRAGAGDLKRIAWIVAHAEAAAWVIATAYKVVTGRTQPEFLTHLNTADISRDFHFGFLEYGMYWGWPSAHAATACAMAAALYALYSRSRIVRYVAIPYAIYMIVGAAIGFHWLSDALAGALVGTGVGLSIARMRASTATESAP